MFKINIDLIGKNEMERFLRQEPKRFEKNIGKGLGDIGEIVADKASSLAPEDTGELSRSITFKLGKHGKEQQVNVYVPTDSKAGAYAYRMNESRYKVRSMKSGAGRLFMDRALSQKTPSVYKVLQDTIDKTVSES